MENKNNTYLILTIILLILSAIGIFFLIQIYQGKNTTSVVSSSTPKIELIPTDTIKDITPTITITATPSGIKITPTASPTAKVTPKITPKITPTAIPTLKPTLIPTSIITPTPVSSSSATILNFSSATDGFSIVYNSIRKLYQDTEASGDRFTFTNPSGNFAIHVGLNGAWAWTNSNRQFNSSVLIAGQPTFRYDTSAQTIVDLQSNGKNYTIQCVHNGLASLKTECDQFLKSFQLL